MKDNTNKQGRRSAYISKTKQVEYVEAYHNSGLTIREFAKENDINYQTCCYWLYKNNTKKGKSQFVELNIQDVPSRENVEIILPNGVIVKLHSCTNENAITAIMQAAALCLAGQEV